MHKNNGWSKTEVLPSALILYFCGHLSTHKGLKNASALNGQQSTESSIMQKSTVELTFIMIIIKCYA